MPRCPPECPFGHRIYVCGVDGCTKSCSTWGGVKRHIKRWHLHSRIHPHPADPTETDEDYQDYDFPDGVDPPGLDEPNAGVGQHHQVRKVSYHPLLDGVYDLVHPSNSTSTYHCHAGTPCDCAGHYLPPNSSPPLHPSPLPGDYGPYESRAAFELAEFLYRREQMPATKINELLGIMASMYDNDPPFRSHKDMYDTIDATRHGDSPWLRRPKANLGQTTTLGTLRGGEGRTQLFERKPKESSNGEPPGAGLHSIYTRIHVGCARLSIGLCTVHDIIVELRPRLYDIKGGSVHSTRHRSRLL